MSEQEPLTEREQERWEELAKTPHEDLSDSEVTGKIKLSMKRKYSAPEWALAFELASPDRRRADAIAVNTFPSRNFKVLGFEFKASRSDWRSEKREGAKADYFVKCVDEWYVVAGRRGIVKEKELPEGWGLLELKDNRDDQLWNLVESNLTEHQQGDPDRAFWGRFLQKTVGETSNFTTEDLEEARSRGYEDGKEEGADILTDRKQERMKKKAESYDQLHERFDFIPITGTSDERLEQIDQAWHVVRQLDPDSFRNVLAQIDSLRDFIDRRTDDIDEQLAEFQDDFEDLGDDLDFDTPDAGGSS